MHTLSPLACLFLLVSSALPGQTMVKDINPGAAWSVTSNIVGLNGIAYFSAYEPVNGAELWRSDGTVAGTWMVKDFDPAPGASGFPTGVDILVMFQGVLLLAASDGTQSARLWRSDGTTAGTVLVSSAAAVSNLTVAGNRVFFFGTTPLEGRELWITDGTAAGTHMVVDLAPGGISGAGHTNSPTDQMVAVGNDVYYAGGTNGWTYPCKSDGTASGTGVVALVNPSGGALPTNFTAFGNKVLFNAYEPTHGREFWVSDGTTTVMLRDINPGPASSWLYDHGRGVDFGGRVFFWANDVVNGNATWVSDGTPAGTQVFFAPYPGLLAYGSDVPMVAGDRLYFRANTAALGWELYVSDGITAPTLVRDLFPGPGNGMWGTPESMRASISHIGSGRVAVYSGNDGTSGDELTITDGTSAGTFVLANLSTGTGGSSPKRFSQVGGNVFFMANDGVHGQEVWVMPLGLTQAAVSFNYGSGCPGTGGLVPAMRSAGAPTLGNAGYGVRVTQGLPSAVCLLLANFAPASVLVGGGCTLLVGLPAVSLGGITDGSGAFQHGFPIPANTSYLGLETFWQGVVIDPLGALQGILSVSDGLRVRLGH